MKQDPFSGVYRALSPKELAEMFMNPNAPKTEAEHWAVREIEKQRAEIKRLRADLATQQVCCDGAAAQDAHVRQEREEHRAEVERHRAEIERMRAALKGIDALYPDVPDALGASDLRGIVAQMGDLAVKALEGRP